MPPTKTTDSMVGASKGVTKSIVSSLSRRAISTRNGLQNAVVPSVGKRKADMSPQRAEKGVKRSALGNVTSAVLNAIEDSKKFTRSKTDAKKATITVTNPSTAKTNEYPEVFAAPKATTMVSASGVWAARGRKVVTRSSARGTDTISSFVNEATVGLKKVAIAKGKKKTETATNNNNVKAKVIANAKAVATAAAARMPSSGSDTDTNKNDAKTKRRISDDFETMDSENSHYLSALEDLTTSSMRLSVGDLRRKSGSSDASGSTDVLHTIAEDILPVQVECIKIEEPLPSGVNDFDHENWEDPTQVSDYAHDIFCYLKEREELFKIDAYLERQPHLTNWMRTLLVDWMVEVQETFELNHETLYLAVKIVDIYLSKVQIEKEKLQLIGAAALFISCKYDERTPPLIDDFLYICDGAYKQHELIRMEMDAFRTIGYDLGIPLSYRFLRRYARCAKVTMPELTLARFILEFSLMSYDLITLSDSKVAAASLFMALRMSNKTGWNKTLQYFSGYKLDDFKSIIPLLNGPLHQKQRDANKTIRNKYAHKIFFEVSTMPLLSDEQILQSPELIEEF